MIRHIFTFIIFIAASVTASAFPGKLDEVLDSLDAAVEQAPAAAAVAKPQVSRLIAEGVDRWRHDDYPLALAAWNEALDLTDGYGTQLGIIARNISAYYAYYEGDSEDRLYYLALSALSDVRTGVEHSEALSQLGRILLKRGDYQRAEAYILYSEPQSPAANLYLSADRRHDIHLIILYCVIFLLTLALIVLAYLYLKQRHANHLLAAEKEGYYKYNLSQEEVIQQLLRMCEAGMEGNDDLIRLVGRKIKAGQAQDLLRSVEDGKFQAERAELFCRAFDEMIYTILPDFKAQVNELFMSDKQIEVTDGPQLTAELRILAFMRLGIDEPTKLNRFLGLSINTIYTYRNKAKSRALDRDNFDQNIKNIGK